MRGGGPDTPMRRRTLPLVLAGLVLVATVVPAGAQTPARYRAEASSAALSLSLPGNPDVLQLGRASASVTDQPQAIAEAAGIVGVDASSAAADVSSDGASVRDPESGANCAVPTLPDPLGSLVVIQPMCGAAQASITSNLPSATADATLGSISINGSLLADLLTDLVLGPLEDALGPALQQIEDQVLDPVTDAVAEACSELVASLPDPPVDPADILDLLPEPIQEAIDALGPESDDPCVILLELITDPPVIGSPSEVLGNLRAVIEEALSALDLFGIGLGTADAATAATATAVTAAAAAATVSAAIPPLTFLLDLIDQVLTAVVGDFVGAVEALVEPVEEALAAIPLVGDLVDTLLGLLELDWLNADEPLLSVSAVTSSAQASYDRSADTSTGSGTPGTVVVAINSALAELLGIDATTTIAAGQTVTVAEDTPLESTISVGDATVTEDEVDGMRGTSVEVSGITLALLTGLDGGIVLEVAPVSVSARGAPGTVPAEAPPPAPAPPNLPRTGGGLVALSLLAVALAATLRRRLG